MHWIIPIVAVMNRIKTNTKDVREQIPLRLFLFEKRELEQEDKQYGIQI